MIIYKVIGRVVCFSDPLMPLKSPTCRLKTIAVECLKHHSNSHLAWLDPSKEEAWQYIIDIAEEALSLVSMKFNMTMYVFQRLQILSMT